MARRESANEIMGRPVDAAGRMGSESNHHTAIDLRP